MQNVSHESELHDFEQQDKNFAIENGLGINISIPKRLSMSSNARFRGAMKLLDLQPYQHQSQRCLSVGAESGTRKKKLKRWPQRTLLVKSTACSDD